MRKIIVTEFVSLDGVAESPEKWSLKFWSDQIGAFKNDELFSVDALLLGRVTYEGFAGAWPSRTGDPYSDRMNSMPKYVASTRLKDARWNNSAVIRDVAKLKQQSGGDLLVFGSMSLVNALQRENLVDEYRLLVYPVVLGEGKRLFSEGTQATLKLTEAKAFDPGVGLLVYSR